MTFDELFLLIEGWGLKPSEGAKVLGIQKSRLSEGKHNVDQKVQLYISYSAISLNEVPICQRQALFKTRLIKEVFTFSDFLNEVQKLDLIPNDCAKVLGIQKSRFSEAKHKLGKPAPLYLYYGAENLNYVPEKRKLELIEQRLSQITNTKGFDEKSLNEPNDVPRSIVPAPKFRGIRWAN